MTCWPFLQGVHNGMKQMSANKPLEMPTDANGLKFRVQNSEVLKAQMAALGGSPQPMAFSEVYGALQTGVVDGQENTWSNIYGKKFFEVQDGVTETNHGIIDYMLVTSTDWWDTLDEECVINFRKSLLKLQKHETQNLQLLMSPQNKRSLAPAV